MSVFFFFNDTATTEIYTLSLHDALPIWAVDGDDDAAVQQPVQDRGGHHRVGEAVGPGGDPGVTGDDHAAFQVPLRDHLEQRGVAVGVQPPIPELVNDQQFRSGVEAQHVRPAALAGGPGAAGGEVF